MSDSKAHTATANRIARMLGTEYNRGKGADVKGAGITVEVETELTVADAGRQLQGNRSEVYVAGTNRNAVAKALERYKDSTIGVMDNKGRIVKPSTRRR